MRALYGMKTRWNTKALLALAIGVLLVVCMGVLLGQSSDSSEPDRSEGLPARAPAPARVPVLGARQSRVYALGGRNDDGSQYLSSVEMYDPATNRWTPVAPMGTARSALAAVALGINLYALGGEDESKNSLSSMEMYDPATNRWSAVAPMGTERSALAAVANGGKIYALGGVTTGPKYGASSARKLSSAEMYDPATKKWSTVAPMRSIRSTLAAVSLAGKIYALGGEDEKMSPFLNSVEVFDPATNKWSATAPMRTARSQLAAVALGAKIYALGGYVWPDKLSSVEVYDPDRNTRWSLVARMETRRAALAAVALGGKIYAQSGEGPAYNLSSVEVYEPARNKWSAVAPMLTPRIDLAAVACCDTNFDGAKQN